MSLFGRVVLEITDDEALLPADALELLGIIVEDALFEFVVGEAAAVVNALQDRDVVNAHVAILDQLAARVRYLLKGRKNDDVKEERKDGRKQGWLAGWMGIKGGRKE